MSHIYLPEELIGGCLVSVFLSRVCLLSLNCVETGEMVGPLTVRGMAPLKSLPKAVFLSRKYHLEHRLAESTTFLLKGLEGNFY